MNLFTFERKFMIMFALFILRNTISDQIIAAAHALRNKRFSNWFGRDIGGKFLCLWEVSLASSGDIKGDIGSGLDGVHGV